MTVMFFCTPPAAVGHSALPVNDSHHCSYLLRLRSKCCISQLLSESSSIIHVQISDFILGFYICDNYRKTLNTVKIISCPSAGTHINKEQPLNTFTFTHACFLCVAVFASVFVSFNVCCFELLLGSLLLFNQEYWL